VVAAGEAQIESTVTGNTSTALTSDKMAALKDQSQVYLPINNALSEVGCVVCGYCFRVMILLLTFMLYTRRHVYGFLKELGQGIQHIASRVENLTDFVQRANDNRKRTGEVRAARRNRLYDVCYCSNSSR
jgi:aerobic-type carbon monoxide dehydrogenase small subunit (CoxS/CutS family)